MIRKTCLMSAAILATYAANVSAAHLGQAVILTGSQRLVSIELANPSNVTSNRKVRGLADGETLLDIDYRPANGRLYGLTSLGNIVTLNPITGRVLSSVPLVAAPASLDPTPDFAGLVGTQFDIDFNPIPDRLRVVSDAGQNLRINVDNGATITDGPLTAGSAITGAAYTNPLRGASATTLYTLDSQAATLNIQNPPNDGTQVAVGPLGLTPDNDLNGFDIRGTDGLAVAGLRVGRTAGLYRIDLTTGATTLLSDLAGVGQVAGLALPTPRTVLYGVAANNQLFTIDVPASSAAPATAGTVLPQRLVGTIAPLPAGEVIEGIDVRPSTGALTALGRSGALYTLDRDTAAVTGTVTLSADPTDTQGPSQSANYTTLADFGSNFGVDFNPIGPVALRITSATGDNLRVGNPLTGNTFGDGLLNPAPVEAVAAAYINNFAGNALVPQPTTTQLLVIDALSNTLGQVTVANDGGPITSRGSLGVTLADNVASFDIIGGQNGVVFASLTTVPMARPALYSLNLTTGAATFRGQIGPDTNKPVITSIALSLE